MYTSSDTSLLHSETHERLEERNRVKLKLMHAFADFWTPDSLLCIVYSFSLHMRWTFPSHISLIRQR